MIDLMSSMADIETYGLNLCTYSSWSLVFLIHLLLLVGETTCGGFETLGGDKTHCFITRTQAYN
jgi:hypothetical protein